jgi:hypothetical protein
MREGATFSIRQVIAWFCAAGGTALRTAGETPVLLSANADGYSPGRRADCRFQRALRYHQG